MFIEIFLLFFYIYVYVSIVLIFGKIMLLFYLICYISECKYVDCNKIFKYYFDFLL